MDASSGTDRHVVLGAVDEVIHVIGRHSSEVMVQLVAVGGSVDLDHERTTELGPALEFGAQSPIDGGRGGEHVGDFDGDELLVSRQADEVSDAPGRAPEPLADRRRLQAFLVMEAGHVPGELVPLLLGPPPVLLHHGSRH